jgi:hypothetical protein
MKPNEPTTLAQDLEQATKAEYQKQTWTEQSESIRRLNGRVLARTAALIDAGVIDDQVLGMLARLSSIAKSWAAAEDVPPKAAPTRAELEAIANKGK